MEGVPFVGNDACAHNLLLKGRPLIMRLRQSEAERSSVVSNVSMRPARLVILLAFLLTIGTRPPLVGQSNQPAQLVQVGSHKMFLNCAGKETRPTVILEAGTGDSSEVWKIVQEQVQKFARV